MKIKLFLATLITIFFSTTLFAEKLNLDLEKSQISWVGKKVVDKHDGTLAIKSGFVEVEDDKIIGGEFVLDLANGIVCKDIESPTYNKKLVDHLKSEDFFFTEKHPEGKFVLKGANPRPEKDVFTIVGDLTLRGITNLVSFPAKVTKSENGTYLASATTEIDRTNWDLKYNSGKFFDPAQLGDKLILNEIEVGIELVTK